VGGVQQRPIPLLSESVFNILLHEAAELQTFPRSVTLRIVFSAAEFLTASYFRSSTPLKYVGNGH